jgi:hypothetical protein
MSVSRPPWLVQIALEAASLGVAGGDDASS